MQNKLFIVSILLVAAMLLFGCTSASSPSAPAAPSNPSMVQPSSAAPSTAAPAPSDASNMTAPSNTTAPASNMTANASANSSANASARAPPPSVIGTQFSAWKYYPMANPIAPGPISAEAQAAMNVFTVVQAPQSDGSILVTVNDRADGMVNNFTVNSGETLYFSDGFAGDDVANETDSTLIDDHFVLVDSNNTIVGMLDTP